MSWKILNTIEDKLPETMFSFINFPNAQNSFVKAKDIDEIIVNSINIKDRRKGKVYLRDIIKN